MALERGHEGETATRVPISFPEDLYEWLREAAFRRRISMAEIVREAVREHRLQTDPQLDLPIGKRKSWPS